MSLDLKHTRAPFLRTSVPYGDTGARREVARYACGCGKTIDVAIKPGQAIATDAHRKQLANNGWMTSSRADTVICPMCIHRTAPKGSTPPMTATVEKLPAPVPRGPNTEQRLAIRHALDTHFDDKVGTYLGDQSDQAVADTLNIPRHWVETIREAAYGPIRLTPQIVALRKDLVSVQAAHDANRKTLTALEAAHEDNERTIKDLLSRLQRLERQDS